MASAVMNQAAIAVDLMWTQNDPISFEFHVIGEDWRGTYTAQIRNQETDALICELDVVATFPADDTIFTMQNFEVRSDPIGVAVWALKIVDGPTRLAGKAHIKRGPVHA